MGTMGGFKKSGSGKGKQAWISREGDKGVPPGMPSGKTDTKASGNIVFLSRQGGKGNDHVKGKSGGAGSPLD